MAIIPDLMAFERVWKKRNVGKPAYEDQTHHQRKRLLPLTSELGMCLSECMTQCMT